MAKRRFRPSTEEKAPEELTPEERRLQRRREKAQGRSGRFRKGFGSPLRRAMILGIPVAAIVVIVLFVFLNPLGIASPCLTLQPAPNAPYFPPSSTTDFSGSWCPPNRPTTVLAVEPLLHIVINGSAVSLPAGIGINRSYAAYTCNLPITTPATAGTLPTDVFQISSPWLYAYNLSWFFQAWAQTFSTAHVDATHPSQPVTYTATDLLGFTTSKTAAITLFVDNHPSSAGPGLVLSNLDNVGNPFPSCISSVYGSHHTILLQYGSAGASAGTHTPPAPVGATAAAPHAPTTEASGIYARLTGSAHDRSVSAFGFAVARGFEGS